MSQAQKLATCLNQCEEDLWTLGDQVWEDAWNCLLNQTCNVTSSHDNVACDLFLMDQQICQPFITHFMFVFGVVSLQLKNAGRKLGRRCDMCSNYEKQLQVMQGQEADTREQVWLFVPFKITYTSPFCSNYYIVNFLWFLQVKKLQVMLRQANDQLERTMNERQELEDSIKQANEETTAKVKLISLM